MLYHNRFKFIGLMLVNFHILKTSIENFLNMTEQLPQGKLFNNV